MIRVDVRSVRVSDGRELFNLIRIVNEQSTFLWPAAVGGEMVEEMMRDEGILRLWGFEFEETSAAKVLIMARICLIASAETDTFEPWAFFQLPLSTNILDCTVRLAALACCGLGMSALKWSERRLSPVLVETQGRQFLALAPSSAVHGNSQCKFYLAASNTSRGVEKFILLARHPGVTPVYTPCLFPWDVELSL